MKRISRNFLILGCLAACTLTACNKNQNAAPANAPSQAGSAAKRYRLQGKVVSIDKQAKMANIDAAAIPDFMGAMTMPYQIKPESELDKLTPGDAITADVVDSGDTYWLENVVVTGHSAPAASK